MNEEIEKIQIPEEPVLETPNDTAKSLADLMKLSITEEKQMVPLDNFKWVATLDSSSVYFIILKIQNEPEVINNDWHFIPYDIAPEDRPKHDRKTGHIQFFCIDDLKSRKKFTKTIRKYFQFQLVEWHPFDAQEFKQEKKNLKNK